MLDPIVNSIFAWQNSILAGAITLIIFYPLRAILIKYLAKIANKTTNQFDNLIVEILKTVNHAFALSIALLVTLTVQGISWSESITLLVILATIITYQLNRVLKVVFNFGVSTLKGEEGTASLQALLTILQIAVWISGFIFVLAQLGYNITSLAASLGIGGIAIALALQNILSDIFSSFSLYFDKPFKVGDYIVIGELDGVVERIGLKTTRLRSLRGEEVVVSNRQLTESSVRNFGQMQRRRVVESLGFEYGTPTDKLKELRFQLPGILDAIDGITFDRLHFKVFAASALEFELVYYVESADFMKYIESEHQVNLAIKDYCEEKGIEMAFNTQTIHVKK